MEKEFQRWTAKRKVELLLQSIRGSRSGMAHVAAAALEDALPERHITQGDAALTLRSRQRPRVRREGLR